MTFSKEFVFCCRYRREILKSLHSNQQDTAACDQQNVYTKCDTTKHQCAASATLCTTSSHLQYTYIYILTTTIAILRPLYRTTCISWHPQLRTGGFCWSKVLLPHALDDGNKHIHIREKTLEFSSVVLPVLSPYHPDLYYNYVFFSR